MQAFMNINLISKNYINQFKHLETQFNIKNTKIKGSTLLRLFFLCMAIGYLSWEASAQDSLQLQSLFKTEQDQEVACYRIPALTTAPNGDLIAAIDERVPSCGDLKWNKNINIVIRRSTDNGKTWLPIETVVDYPLGQSASDPSLIVDRDTKSIFLFFNFMDLDKEKDVYYFKYIKSTDNGKTWSGPVDITEQISLPNSRKDFQFITSGRGVQTKNGRLLHTLVNLDKGVFIFGSKDHGKTWFVNENPLSPGDESKIIELENGDWMVNSRVNKAGYRYIHTSSNQGKSWETYIDSSLIDPACNASLLVYPDKKSKTDLLIFSNLDSQEKRQHLTIKISKDHGKTWSRPKTIYKGAAAYSSLTILKNGDIGLFFEKDDYTDNVFTYFSLDWLLQ